jgi:hypothetical protein
LIRISILIKELSNFLGSSNLAFWREYMAYLTQTHVRNADYHVEVSSLESGIFSRALDKNIIDLVVKHFGQDIVDDAINGK